jgi:hypothetical protein
LLWVNLAVSLLAAWSFFAFVLAHFSYIIIALGVDWDGIFVWA